MSGFCPNCGASVPENSTFCQACGRNLKTGVLQPQNVNVDQNIRERADSFQMARQAERMGELNTLDNMIGYFSQKMPEYEEYDTESEKLSKYEIGRKKAPKVWGIILTILGSVITVVTLLIMIAMKVIGDKMGMPVETGGLVGSFSIAVIFYGAAFFVPGIIMLVVNAKNEKKYWKDFEYTADRYDFLYNDLNVYYRNYGYCPIGFEYSHPKVLQLVKDMIKSGRANNTTDAINTMIEDHRREVELYTQQLIAAHTASGSAADWALDGILLGAFLFL